MQPFYEMVVGLAEQNDITATFRTLR